MAFDDGPEQYDFRPSDDESELPDDVQEIVERLRDSLTHDMAIRAFRCRVGEEPSDDAELEMFMDELVAEAYNAGYEEWDEDFLVYD